MIKRTQKNKIKTDKQLKEFIKSGGRKDALKDFNLILKKSVGVKK
jgi:hypothetical protein